MEIIEWFDNWYSDGWTESGEWGGPPLLSTVGKIVFEDDVQVILAQSWGNTDQSGNTQGILKVCITKRTAVEPSGKGSSHRKRKNVIK